MPQARLNRRGDARYILCFVHTPPRQPVGITDPASNKNASSSLRFFFQGFCFDPHGLPSSTQVGISSRYPSYIPEEGPTALPFAQASPRHEGSLSSTCLLSSGCAHTQPLINNGCVFTAHHPSGGDLAPSNPPQALTLQNRALIAAPFRLPRANIAPTLLRTKPAPSKSSRAGAVLATPPLRSEK